MAAGTEGAALQWIDGKGVLKWGITEMSQGGGEDARTEIRGFIGRRLDAKSHTQTFLKCTAFDGTLPGTGTKKGRDKQHEGRDNVRSKTKIKVHQEPFCPGEGKSPSNHLENVQELNLIHVLNGENDQGNSAEVTRKLTWEER